MQKKHLPKVRGMKAAFITLFGAMLLSGGAMFVLRQPSRASTIAANNGARSQPSQPDQLQQLHEGLSSLVVIVAIVGGAWIMLKVHEDWSTGLAAAFASGVIAVASGMAVRFDAVQINGVFVEDLRGFWFIFDGDLDQVLFGQRSIGPNMYRIWILVHLTSSVGWIVGAMAGLREIRQEPKSLERLRAERAEARRIAG